DQQKPAICGNIVVWQDDFFGDWDIYAAEVTDPANPVELSICDNSFSQQNPDIDGNIIVWQDDRNGNWDIYGYNLTTREEFRITDDPYDQTNPAISANVVVWQDNRSGNSNIYAVILDGPEAARCASWMPGDVNGDCKIDFFDFAVMTSRWLECNLEPEESCSQ
ncbi:MAG: TolB family protein, partial [Planctomycetota bacterium]